MSTNSGGKVHTRRVEMLLFCYIKQILPFLNVFEIAIGFFIVIEANKVKRGNVAAYEWI